MQEHSTGQLPGAVVVRARHTATIAFVILTAFWVLVLIVAEAAQSTTSGRIAAGVFFGLLIVASVGGWFGVNSSRRQLEVRRDAIVYRPGTSGKPPFTLASDAGGTLRILPQFKMLGTTRPPRLVLLGTGGFITLGRFPLDEVRRACEAQGWSLDGDTSVAVKDVQRCLHEGRSVEAAQLVELFGPFPATAADGEQHTGLVAAVFEDFGDKLSRTARSNAAEAYRRAALAQRGFAGYARSPDESAERIAEADRIDGKARR